jgi:A/G-specific adenine glycosylase
MMEVPGSKWDHKDAQRKKKDIEHPVRASWQKLPGQVRHSFTHFDLHLTVYRASSEKKLFTKAVWADMDRLSNHALPTLFKKVIRHAVKNIS